MVVDIKFVVSYLVGIVLIIKLGGFLRKIKIDELL